MFRLLLVCLLLWPFTCLAQELFETNSDFPAEFEQNLFAPGVAEVLSSSIYGSTTQLSLFADVTFEYMLPKGVVLCTGRASEIASLYIPPVNTLFELPEAYNYSFGYVSAHALDPIIWEVTFRPLVDTLVLDYQFGSYEYPEYSCSIYNDMAGIFLEGPGYSPFQSLTELSPFSPLNVHNVFCDYQLSFIDTEWLMGVNGLAEKQQRILGLERCQTYTIRFVIFNMVDHDRQSGLFVGTIHAKNPNLIFAPKDHIYLEGCTTNPAPFMFDMLPDYFPISYSISGTAVPGEDYTLDIPSVGAINMDNPWFFFQPQILADTIPDEGDFITINFLTNADGGCYLQYKHIFYLSEIDSTVMSICEPTNVPAFLPIEPSTMSFNSQVVTPTFGSVFTKIPLTVEGFPYPLLTTQYMIDEICPHTNADRSYLESNQGHKLELNTSEDNSFDSKCFSPYAEAVYDGSNTADSEYLPEGYWGWLHNDSINSNWNLIVKPLPSNVPTEPWSMTLTKDFLYREFTYTWSNGLTGPKPEIAVQDSALYLTVDLESQIMKMTVPVTILPPQSDTSMINQILCPGDSLVINGTTYNASNPFGVETLISSKGCDSTVYLNLHYFEESADTIYAVIPSGQSYSVGGQIFTLPGTYTINLTNQVGCDSIILLFLDIASGVTNATAGREVRIYPNPAQQWLQIEADDKIMPEDLLLFDAMGRTMAATWMSTQNRLDLTYMPTGIYMLAVRVAGKWHFIRFAHIT